MEIIYDLSAIILNGKKVMIEENVIEPENLHQQFKCKFHDCSASFENETALDVHVKTSHGNAEGVKCNCSCKKLFFNVMNIYLCECSELIRGLNKK